MALKVKGFPPHEDRVYVPKAFDNRKSDTPARVWIKTPTEKDKRDVAADDNVVRVAIDEKGVPIKDKDGNPMMEFVSTSTVEMQARVLGRFVTRVENYDGAAGPILTGADLAEHGDTGVVLEVYQEIMLSVSLSESESKNSEGSPASSSGAIPVSDGTALSACEPTTAQPGTARGWGVDSIT
jgi:hypothetical protein